MIYIMYTGCKFNCSNGAFAPFARSRNSAEEHTFGGSRQNFPRKFPNDRTIRSTMSLSICLNCHSSIKVSLLDVRYRQFFYARYMIRTCQLYIYYSSRIKYCYIIIVLDIAINRYYYILVDNTIINKLLINIPRVTKHNLA